jgi:hypothetical protein
MGKMTEKEIEIFGNGFRAGANSVYAVLDDIKKKYFFVPKWIWITFIIVSAIESGVLFWHFLNDR